MLFDLRSRRRRSLVRVVYAFLALIMLGGLVLVGVGTGNNNGGLLNAFTNNSSNSGQSSAITQEIKSAEKAIKKDPSSPANWSQLVLAHWSAASSTGNFDSTTGQYSKAGKVQLQDAASAWTKYLSLTKDKPSVETSLLAAGVYQGLDQWTQASQTWQYVIEGQGAGTANALKGYICTALTSYAAGQKPKGELAATEALKLASKSERLELKTDFTSAKSSASTAATYAAAEC
jgi:hypothetical protein